MTDRSSEIVAQLGLVSDEVASSFGDLDAPRLNWKPTAESWSIAQCLDHLITINSLYFPLFEKVTSPNFSQSSWERYSPLSGFFGKYLIKVLSPEYEKKTKTSKKAYPSAGDIDARILEQFREHQNKLAEYIRNISPELDLKKTMITSPLMSLVTYSLDDCLTILAVHERRHLLQAKRVMAEQGFPN
jgi:uncharacterized damage-inducible protein DinB